MTSANIAFASVEEPAYRYCRSGSGYEMMMCSLISLMLDNSCASLGPLAVINFECTRKQLDIAHNWRRIVGTYQDAQFEGITAMRQETQNADSFRF